MISRLLFSMDKNGKRIFLDPTKKFDITEELPQGKIDNLIEEIFSKIEKGDFSRINVFFNMLGGKYLFHSGNQGPVSRKNLSFLIEYFNNEAIPLREKLYKYLIITSSSSVKEVFFNFENEVISFSSKRDFARAMAITTGILKEKDVQFLDIPMYLSKLETKGYKFVNEHGQCERKGSLPVYVIFPKGVKSPVQSNNINSQEEVNVPHP